jgi:PQQ-like domain
MKKGRIFRTIKRDYALHIFLVIAIALVVNGIIFIPLKHSTDALKHSTGASSQTATTSQVNWITYMWNPERSGYNSKETIINPSSASHLKIHWKYAAKGSINTEPVVFNGVIYWGAWDGYERAMNLSGTMLWQTYLGTVSPGGCDPKSAGVASTATVATVSIGGVLTSVILVGGGDARFYALNATTGHIIWSTQLGTSPTHMIWDSPAFYNGSVYIGTSSYGDCPQVHGQIFRLDATTGTIQNTFTSPCGGGGVWGSLTIDEPYNTIYAATGNGNCNTGFALLKLSATNLSLISSWQVPSNERTGDDDFGTAPSVFPATINNVVRQLVGVENKSGTYFALDRANLSAGPVWKVRLSTDVGGNHSTSSWDNRTLYIGGAATSINGKACGGSIRAMNPATGGYLWQYCTSGKVAGAVMLVPGLVIAGAGRSLIVLNAQSGQQLFSYQDTASSSFFWGTASVSDGVLYIGNKDGQIYAFGL